MKRIHYFQQVPFENLGAIEAWAAKRGHKITATRFFDNQLPPVNEKFDWLIVMGGPMGVHDDQAYPWLSTQKKAIEAALTAGKVVLGICLGAQLIADVLGAEVRPNAYNEIGWFPIYLANDILDHPIAQLFPPQWTGFHWHGDTFGVPEGARLFATSAGCRNQGFLYGDRVVGLQFHLEMTLESTRTLVQNCPEDLQDGLFVQPVEKILDVNAPFSRNRQLLEQLLDFLNSQG
jgi:GMP synthase (glutamine-hydrolysing)